ncbi:flagellar basal body P-ring formation chaperone FlgA [Paracoccus sp. p4-l81]|uniref:flagellar basal body P-ring formation chaperone FlgA n=1 Tax=unclassified Paracoccus (in: a-proteobacteria) TaxID=2688777 RepID=UPI0035BACABF
MWSLVILLIGLASQAAAEPPPALVARHMLRAGITITAEDIGPGTAAQPGALSDPAQAIGLETRVAVYAGRPIRAEDLRSPTMVDRNQIVALTYRRGGLTITAEGRALGRGGAGDTVRVMNTLSHSTVQAVIGPDGTLNVLP